MQTTLLSLGIAAILTLLTALVGPLFVDWNQFRAEIEAQATATLGVPVRVTGPIDARLLPTPSLNLGSVELSPAGGAPTIAARRIAVEFRLGPLLGGKFEASDLTIDGAEATVGLDRNGSIEMPAGGLAVAPDSLTIDHLIVENSRVTLRDAASGGRLVIDDLRAGGDVRSLIGPFRLEGAFAVNSAHYVYRVSASRRDDNGGMKMRLMLEPAELPLGFESEGVLTIEAGVPHYEGSATVTRSVEADHQPWKVSGKVKAAPTGASLEQIDFQYGQDVRSLHLSGAAELALAPQPHVTGKLSARQIDLDRLASGPKRSPVEAFPHMLADLAASPVPPLPVRFDVAVDSLTVAGSTLTGLHGAVASRPDGWSADAIELRAPGSTLITVSGTFAPAAQDPAGQDIEFTGPVVVDSADPGAFLAWLEGRSTGGQPVIAPIRANGRVTLGDKRLAVTGLAADIDRKPLKGSLDYRFGDAAAPGRIAASVTADELDIDRTRAIGAALLEAASAAPPGEVSATFDIGRAVVAGLGIRGLTGGLTYDPSGLAFRELKVQDVEGLAIDAGGRLDDMAATLLDAADLAEKFTPAAANVIQRYAQLIAPLRTTPPESARGGSSAGSGDASPHITIKGTVAGITADVAANVTADAADPRRRSVSFSGKLDATDARVLASVVRLDSLINPDQRPARLTFQVGGAWDRPLQTTVEFTGTDTMAKATGTITRAGEGSLKISLRAPDVKIPGRARPGRLSIDESADAELTAGGVELKNISGKIANATVKGRLAIGNGQPRHLEGRIDTDFLDAAEVVGMLSGASRPQNATPRASEGAAFGWSSEPFSRTDLPEFEGALEFTARNARWIAGLQTTGLEGKAVFGAAKVSFTGLKGTLADGQLTLDGEIRREASGLAVKAHAGLVNANIASLFAGALRVPAAGRIRFDADVQGQGLSPASLMGALNGGGTLKLEDVELSGLSPAAIDAVITALDRDRRLAANPRRLAEIADARLDGGRLRVPTATSGFSIQDGRLEVAKLDTKAELADLSASFLLGLDDGQFDATVAMTGPQRPGLPAGERPVLTVSLKGPLDKVRRSAGVGRLATWYASLLAGQEAKRADDAEKEIRRLEAIEALRRQSEAAGAADGALPAPGSPASAGRGSDGAAPPPSDFKSGPLRRNAAPLPARPAAPGPQENNLNGAR